MFSWKTVNGKTAGSSDKQVQLNILSLLSILYQAQYL